MNPTNPVAVPDLLADACGEVPLLEIVQYNTERHERIGYLDRFAGYFRQLGFTDAEHRSLKDLSRSARARLLEQVGQRQGWLADPEAHLRAAGCGLLLVVGEALPAHMGVAALPPDQVLERYARLRTDVRLFIGVDPHDPASLDRALALADHPRAAGLAVSPYLAGMAIDHPSYRKTLEAARERDLVLWVHACAHFRADVAYDIEHPRHLDAVLVRHGALRIIFGHAGWPWADEACVVAMRHASTALEFATFPPVVLREPGWSLTPLLAHRATLRGRIFFGSGATSSPARFGRLVRQLDELDLGGDLALWRGNALRDWLGK